MVQTGCSNMLRVRSHFLKNGQALICNFLHLNVTDFNIFSCSIQTEADLDLNQKCHELNIEGVLKVTVKVSREDFCFITAKTQINDPLCF